MNGSVERDLIHRTGLISDIKLCLTFSAFW